MFVTEIYDIYILYICMTWMNDCRVRVWKYEVRREFMTDKWRDTCDTPQRRPEKTAEINDIADATRTELEETEEWSCVYMGSNSVWRHENTCDITRRRQDRTAENDSERQRTEVEKTSLVVIYMRVDPWVRECVQHLDTRHPWVRECVCT